MIPSILAHLVKTGENFSTNAQPALGISSTLHALLKSRYLWEKGCQFITKMPVWLPIVILLVAMASIQGGASLAKSLFPLVGAPGVTALRLALGTLILIAFFKPWRLRFAKEQRLPLLFYGVSLGGMNYLFYLSIQTVPLGIAVALEFTGPLAVALFSSRCPVDFVWVVLAVLGLWFLLPLGQDVSHVDLTGCALALGAPAC